MELTGQNPYKDFDTYLALRGDDPILWIYGCAKGKEEEKLSHVSNSIPDLRHMYDSILYCIQDGAESGFIANTDSWLVRVIYKKNGENEFDFRTTCRFETPKSWEPEWE